MSIDIRIKRENESHISIRLPNIDYNCKLKPEQSLDIGDFLFGYWDGEKFQIVSRDLIRNKVKIESIDVPIALIDFQSTECEVHSPSLEIENISKIDCLEVHGNKNDNPNESKLIINGGLLTKNLIVNCSIEINGELYFKEDGILKFYSEGYCKLTIIINKNLGSKGELKIDKPLSTILNIINHGEIFSGNGKLSCVANEFRNESDGKIVMECGNFKFSLGGQFINYGELIFKDFSIEGRTSMKDFLQNGICQVEEKAVFDCSIISKGETIINHLIFPKKIRNHMKDLKVEQGHTIINKVTGKMSIIESNNGGILEIGERDGDTDLAKSSGNNSKLALRKINSNSKLIFSAKSGGSTYLNEGDIPESFGYSEDGELYVSDVKGKSTVYVDKTAKLKVDKMENLSLLANEDAKAQITQSNLKNVLLKNKKSLIFKSKIDTIHNHSELKAIDMETNKINNEGEIEFWNSSSTKKINDRGNLTFRDGDHKIDNYHSSNSRFKVEGRATTEEEGGRRLLLEERDESPNPEVAALLSQGQAKVSIGNLSGGGSIECENQVYHQIVPMAYDIKGTTDVYLNRLPRQGEIPIHEGTFTYKVDMDKDYINREVVNYEGAILDMNLHGKYKFINENGDFNAGGLIVKDAKEFKNKNGHIKLEKVLDVDTENFKSEGDPIARENGRRVDYSWLGHHVSYYCPATYYSENKNTEIEVFDGPINIKSKNNIENRFGSMKTSETFTASADGNFENTVGTIIAEGEGKSKIKAKNIKNACLPAFCRKGEGHNCGSSGNLFSRESWFIHHYTREMITQSHGSKIIVGGDMECDGNTTNFGSKIKVEGLLSGKGNINSESLFENEALIETGGASLEGLNINNKKARFIIHDNDSKFKEIEARVNAITL